MRIFSIMAAATVIGLIVSTAKMGNAAILNSSFETGDFSQWEITGQATVEDASFGAEPSEGTYQAVLETLQDTTNISGANLESFLGLSGGSLTNSGVTEGSAIKQTFVANAGDVLTFQWNFLTDLDPSESNYDDFAFFTLSDRLNPLADTSNATNTNFFTRLAKETGYQSSSYKIMTAGTYVLGFGVVDVGDSTVNSALLVDKIKLSNASTSVPEPTSTFSLLALGVLGLSWYLRRHKQSKEI